jgi:1L-myo-inositol 1-phosphate cytidylyltransferase
MNVSTTTKAVILAAGFGSRLDAEEGHKLLVSLGGRTLLEHHARNFHTLGVDEVIVVTGFRADALQEAVAEIEAPPGMSLRCVHNRDFDGPNGISVLAGARALGGDRPCWLTMSDHLFEPALFDDLSDRFQQWRNPNWAGVLCIDRKLETIFDMPDATKLHLQGPRFDIGKEIAPFDVVDVGLFWCAQGFVDALEQELDARGGCSTSDAVRRLVDDDAFGFWDIGPALWQDVDTPGARAHAEGLIQRWDVPD